MPIKRIQQIVKSSACLEYMYIYMYVSKALPFIPSTHHAFLVSQETLELKAHGSPAKVS